jgi:hypothetical protein
MSTEPESPAEEISAFAEYEVAGIGTVIAPEGEPGYRVRLPDGRVTAYPAASGEPCEANAAADIAAAIANSPPAPVPAEISRAEFIIALRKVLNLTEGDVFALLSQMPAGEEQEDARDLWENARVFKRANRFLVGLAQLSGVTEAQLDEVFRVGAALDLD